MFLLYFKYESYIYDSYLFKKFKLIHDQLLYTIVYQGIIHVHKTRNSQSQ
jgi:hypothetical protein